MRSGRFTVPALGLLLLCALLLREGPRPADGAPRRPGIELFVESEAAWNLRRVQLTLASGRVPQFDRAARFPSGGEVVDPPVFVAGLAGTAYLLLDGATGSANGSPLNEGGLADLMRHVGPLLGVLLVLVAHRAAARIGGSSARARALTTAAQLALGAPFVLALEAGRLPLGAWSALLSAFGLTLAAPLLGRDGEMLDRLQTALLAGLVLGLALASSPLAVAAVLPLVVLLGVELYSVNSVELRRARAREALLMMVSMACIAALPAVGGPWQQPSPTGPVGHFARIAPLAILAVGLPMSLAFWPPISRRLEARGLTRSAATIAALLAVGAVLALLPDLPAPRVPHWPPAWVVLQVIAYICCLRSPRHAELRVWCLVLPVAWGVAFFDERGALLAGFAGAVLTAAAIWSTGRRSRRWLLAALATVLVADLAASWMGREAAEVHRAQDAQVAHVLQELRTSTPSAGPWNATRAVMAWCVAAPTALAPAVLLHARRPVLVSRGTVGADAIEPRDAVLWRAADARELSSAARELGVRVLCLRSTDLRELEERCGGELPFVSRLLQAEPLGLDRERYGPVDESGRAAFVVVRFESD